MRLLLVRVTTPTSSELLLPPRRCRRNRRTPETLLILQELEKEHAKHCSFPRFGLRLSEVGLVCVHSSPFPPKVSWKPVLSQLLCPSYCAAGDSMFGRDGKCCDAQTRRGSFQNQVSRGAGEFPGERGGNDEQTHLHLVLPSNKSARY